MVTDIATNVPSVQKIDYTSPHLFTRWGLFYAYVYSERVAAEIVNQVEGQYAFLLKELSDFLMENFYHAED